MLKKFKSRYGDERILTLLEDGSYKVEGRTLYTRHGDGLFDFEGGPCLMVGDRLDHADDEVIIDSRMPRLAEQLSAKGVTVHTMEYDAVSFWAGGFRCSHHPIVRELQ